MKWKLRFKSPNQLRRLLSECSGEENSVSKNSYWDRSSHSVTFLINRVANAFSWDNVMAHRERWACCLIVQSNFVELSYDTKYNVSLCQSVRNQRNVERSSKQNDEVKRATIDNNKNDGNRFITHSLFSLCPKLISTTVTLFLCLSCRTQTNSHAKQKVKNWKWWRSSVDLDRF